MFCVCQLALPGAASNTRQESRGIEPSNQRGILLSFLLRCPSFAAVEVLQPPVAFRAGAHLAAGSALTYDQAEEQHLINLTSSL